MRSRVRWFPGHGVGAKKTVPTLNLATRTEVLPKGGVYVTRTTDLDGGDHWQSVTNIGYRPTFGGDDRLSIETFLLEPLTGRGAALAYASSFSGGSAMSRNSRARKLSRHKF